MNRLFNELTMMGITSNFSIVPGLSKLAEMIREKMVYKKLEKELKKVYEQKIQEYGLDANYEFEDAVERYSREFKICEEYEANNEEAYELLKEESEWIDKELEEMKERIEGHHYPWEIINFDIFRQFIVLENVDEEIANEIKQYVYDYDWLEERGFLYSYAEYNYGAIPEMLQDVADEQRKNMAVLGKGLHGEDYVSRAFEMYQGKYRVLENIVIPANDVGGKTSEVDMYIITDRGIIVAEVKNYGNERKRLHVTSDGSWVIEDVYTGNELERKKSPVEQNARHCLVLERFLKEHFGEDYDVPIYPVVIMANDKAPIINESRSVLIRPSELYTFVNNLPKEESLSKEEQDRIQKLLEQEDLGVNKFSVVSKRKSVEIAKQREQEALPYCQFNCDMIYEARRIYAEIQNDGRFLANLIVLLIAVLGGLIIQSIGFTESFQRYALIIYGIALFNIPIAIPIGIVGFFGWMIFS